MMIDFNSLIGILVSILLLVNIERENRHNVFLCLFFFSISLLSITRNSTFYSGNFWITYYLIPYGTFIFTSTPIFMYLYFKYVIQKIPLNGFLKRDYFHFIIPAILFLNITPHIFISSSEKFAVANLILKDPYNVLGIHTLIFPFSFNLLLRPILGLIYILLSFRLLQKNAEVFQSPERMVELPSIKWFYIILFASLINYLTTFWLGMASKLYANNPFEIYNIKQLMIVPTLSLLVIVGSVFFFPKVIYGLLYKRKPSKRDLSNERMPIGENSIALPKKYTNFEFEPVNSNTVIAEKLKIYFSSKPYLKPSFTLSVITKETNIPYHQLTNYFNNYLGINFNEWKNNARIEFALDLLNSGRAKNLTLESIGYSCGFLSRSNFVNSFRKKVGMTPSEYLRSMPRDKEFVFALDF
ncbi:MAG: hypothetical protein RJA76_676 [Bacteroidota bacterium]